MGGIFYFIQKDQQPGVPGGTDYQEDFFLRAPVYDPGALPVRIPDGYGTLFPSRFHRKSLVSGPGRVGALLCHLELLREGAGRDQNQHLYLYDPGGYGADLCTGSERTGYLDDRGRHASYAGGAVPVGREKRGSVNVLT